MSLIDVESISEWYLAKEDANKNAKELFYIINNNDEKLTTPNTIDNIKNIIFRLLRKDTNDDFLKKHNQPLLLNTVIFKIDMFNLLKRCIISYDGKMYYIDNNIHKKAANFLKEYQNNQLLITYNIKSVIHLEDQEMFPI
jgi:hypothetical protein